MKFFNKIKMGILNEIKVHFRGINRIRLLVTVDEIGITDWELEWKGELPQKEDIIEIYYYLSQKDIQGYEKEIIKEEDYLCEKERDFIGKTRAEFLSSYCLKVKSRSWIGDGYDMLMLSCQLC